MGALADIGRRVAQRWERGLDGGFQDRVGVHCGRCDTLHLMPSTPHQLVSFVCSWPRHFVALGLSLGLAWGCAVEPVELPTAEELAEAKERNRTTDPPLYQLLYDAPVLPEAGPEAAKVRQLVWLRHMDLSTGQLDLLMQVHTVASERLERMKEREAEVVARWQAHEAKVYGEMWTRMADGAPVDAPELNALVDELRELRSGGGRERDLVTARLAALQSVLEAEQPFLRSLSPEQEHLMADAVFFLRHRLDPVGSPGDFKALVGNTYEPGQYAVLQRGLDDVTRAPLDIGGLWQDPGSREGHVFFDARREVLLLLALLEPGFSEAAATARALASAEAMAGSGPSPAAPPSTP